MRGRDRDRDRDRDRSRSPSVVRQPALGGGSAVDDGVGTRHPAEQSLCHFLWRGGGAPMLGEGLYSGCWKTQGVYGAFVCGGRVAMWMHLW